MRETLDEIAGTLETAERSGHKSEIEGTFYITLSDKLARGMATRLRELVRLVDAIERKGYEFKGEPLEDDPNFKQLMAIAGVRP